jgi:hypothetical protein
MWFAEVRMGMGGVGGGGGDYAEVSEFFGVSRLSRKARGCIAVSGMTRDHALALGQWWGAGGGTVPKQVLAEKLKVGDEQGLGRARRGVGCAVLTGDGCENPARELTGIRRMWALVGGRKWPILEEFEKLIGDARS